MAKGNTCKQCVYSLYDSEAEITECYAMPPVVIFDEEDDCPVSLRPIVGAKDPACSIFKPTFQH